LKFFQIFFLSFTLFSIVGCGYKPSINYIKEKFAYNIYLKLDVDIKNGKNSVYLKDEIGKLLITKFNSNLVSNIDNASMIMEIKLQNIKQRALQTDNTGYVKIYRTIAKVQIKYKNISQDRWHIVVLDDYDDYLVDNDSSITEYNKEKSIQNVITKIVYSLVSTLAIKK
jgi:hypothetical protein